jgi:hypothetical protein
MEKVKLMGDALKPDQIIEVEKGSSVHKKLLANGWIEVE